MCIHGEAAGYRILNALTGSLADGPASQHSKRDNPDDHYWNGHELRDLNGTNDRPNVVNASFRYGRLQSVYRCPIRYPRKPWAQYLRGPQCTGSGICPSSESFPMRFQKLEGQQLTFRAEFYNALNHGNHFLPDLNLAAGPSTTPGDGGFGDIVSTVAGQRQIKIYLKYSF